MMRAFFGRHTQLLLSLALLLVLGIFAMLVSGQKVERPYDLDAADAAGLRALHLWLEKLGYTVERTGSEAFVLPENSHLLFVYPNVEPFNSQEAVALRQWVAQGRTLVLIGQSTRETALQEIFGTDMADAGQLSSEAWQQQPLLPASAPRLRTFGGNLSVLDLSQVPQAVTVLATRQQAPLVAVQRVENGLLWQLSSDFDLTNAQLRDPNAAALLLALLRMVPAHDKILFDTYHLYGPDLSNAQRQIGTLQEWLYQTPIGWATLFALGAVLLYLVSQGRRLGPALPVFTEHRRREAAEYVVAMATLYRRAQQRQAVAHHHKRRLKLALGRPWRLNPALPDAEFLRQLHEAEPELQTEEINKLHAWLLALDQQPGEGALVRLVTQIDEFLAKRR